MDAIEKFERFTDEKGLRRTSQRRRIVEVFLATERHLSSQELSEIVRKKHVTIGFATVARTLKLMTEAGLCREVEFGDGIKRYEHNYGHQHHDHLICLECRRFVEIYSPALERLQADLVNHHGFEAKFHRLEIFGICEKCCANRRKTR